MMPFVRPVAFVRTQGRTDT